jgi:hypothetical protein
MQDATFDALRGVLLRLDNEYKIINPPHVKLVDVIRSHQNGPRPVGPYAMLTLQGERDTMESDCVAYTEIDIGTVQDPDLRVVAETRRAMEFLFDIDIFASDALDRARQLSIAVQTAGAWVDTAIIVREVKAPTFSPELVQQRWEGRARFELVLAAMVKSKTLIDVIESVTIGFTSDTGITTSLTAERIPPN